MRQQPPPDLASAKSANCICFLSSRNYPSEGKKTFVCIWEAISLIIKLFFAFLKTCQKLMSIMIIVLLQTSCILLVTTPPQARSPSILKSAFSSMRMALGHMMTASILKTVNSVCFMNATLMMKP